MKKGKRCVRNVLEKDTSTTNDGVRGVAEGCSM